MTFATIGNIKEISEQLDCGFRAFIHKTTGQLLFIPDNHDLVDIDLDGWEEELEALEHHIADYYEIKKWSARQAFDIMVEFAEQLNTNKQLQNKLINALNKKGPYREFKFAIDHSGEYRQQWFDFKNKWQQDFVAAALTHLIQEDK